MTKYKSIPEPFAVSSSSDTEEYDDNDNFEFRKWCGIRRSTVLLVFYIVSYFSYLLLGGYVMSVLETPHEESLKARTKMLKDEFLEKNPLINSEYLSKSELLLRKNWRLWDCLLFNLLYLKNRNAI